MGYYSQGEVGITELLNGDIFDGIDGIHWGACGGEFAAQSWRGAECAGAGAGCERGGKAAVAGAAIASGVRAVLWISANAGARVSGRLDRAWFRAWARVI